jgi:EmrB/QacA subfamily drug resistance transporter
MTGRVDWLVLGNAMLGNFLGGVSTRTFLIGLPTVADGLGTDILGVSWALISFQLSTISLSIVFGRLGDIYGRHRIYWLGFVTITSAAALCGIAQTALQLIAFRFLQGVGSAMTQSAARALAIDAMPEGSVGKAQGLMTLAFHTGFFVGPPLGGLILDHLNWRWIFFCLVPIGLVGALLASARLKGREVRGPDSAGRSVDYAGSAMFIVLMVMLILLLDRRLAESLRAGYKSVLAVAFAGVLLGFLIHENRAVSPMMNLSLFRIRMFTYSVMSAFALATTYGLVDFMTPFYLQEVLHLAPSFIGIIFLAAPVFTMILAPVSGHLADSIGPRIPATVGVIFFIASSLLGVFLRVDSHWLLPTAMLALTGVGTALFNTPNHTAVFGSLPREDRGFATGIIHTIFGLGNMLGISVGGALLTIAFQHYSGIPGATPRPDIPLAFVSSMNVCYMAALLVSVVALGFSLMRGDAKSQEERR